MVRESFTSPWQSVYLAVQETVLIAVCRLDLVDANPDQRRPAPAVSVVDAAEGEDRGEGTSQLAEVIEVDGDDDTSSPGRTSSSADIAQGEDMRLAVDAKGKGKAGARD